jgi:hypothetical protein
MRERTLGAMRTCALVLFMLVPGALVAACEPSGMRGDPVTAGTTTATTTAASTAPTSSSSPPPVAKAEVTKTIFVRDKLADCEGEGPTKCLQIRESENDDWTLLYTGIEGFQYEESYAYVLRVKSETAKSSPADAPSKKLRLVEVLSKQKPGTSTK